MAKLNDKKEKFTLEVSTDEETVFTYPLISKNPKRKYDLLSGLNDDWSLMESFSSLKKARDHIKDMRDSCEEMYSDYFKLILISTGEEKDLIHLLPE
jgi:hypothetical protein